MIVNVNLTEENEVYATTSGCGCCSDTLYNKEEIINELRRNMSLLRNACELLGISITDLEK